MVITIQMVYVYGIYVENYIYKKLKESVEICKNQTKIQRFRENI